MPDYGNFCPVALATNVVADRWTPLILRELVIGSTRFNDIARGLPGISRSLLTQRLKHLERTGVVERWPLPGGRGHEYRLTPAGKDLEPVLIGLGEWAVHWLYDDLDLSELDPQTLMWWMHRRIDPDRVPEDRVVVQFDHTAPERTSIWLVFERGDVSVCVQHPGFDADVLVTATTLALAEVFQGVTTWKDALATGSVVVDGPPSLVRRLPTWFVWSPFFPATQARVGRQDGAVLA